MSNRGTVVAKDKYVTIRISEKARQELDKYIDVSNAKTVSVAIEYLLRLSEASQLGESVDKNLFICDQYNEEKDPRTGDAGGH